MNQKSISPRSAWSTINPFSIAANKSLPPNDLNEFIGMNMGEGDQSWATSSGPSDITVIIDRAKGSNIQSVKSRHVAFVQRRTTQARTTQVQITSIIICKAEVEALCPVIRDVELGLRSRRAASDGRRHQIWINRSVDRAAGSNEASPVEQAVTCERAKIAAYAVAHIRASSEATVNRLVSYLPIFVGSA